MAATSVILQKTTSDPRFTRGIELSKEKRLEEAVVAFEDLLRTMVEVENKSDSLEIAPVYYEYGNSVLKLAEVTASVFGQGMGARGGHDQEDEEEEEDDQDEDTAEDAATKAAGAVVAGASAENSDVAKNSARDEDDFELAWEMLEIARVIYSRHADDASVQKELARVHLRLGDLGMEIENFPQARSDYKKSLLLQQQLLNKNQSQTTDTTPLADLYCCLAISCIYQQGAGANTNVNTNTNTNTNANATSDASSAISPGEELSDEELKTMGLKYYVLAGRVMAQNVHRVAKQTGKSHVLEFVRKRIPYYDVETGAIVTTTTTTTVAGAAAASNGKGKQKKASEKLELALLQVDSLDTLQQDFMTCVQVAASLTKQKPKEDADQEEAAANGLTKTERELLEFMEIYGELKEKVDGLKHQDVMTTTSSSAVVNGQEEANGAVTTIGFGAPPSTMGGAAPTVVATTIKPKPKAPAAAATATATAAAAAAAAVPAPAPKSVASTAPTATVNVLPVVKKRKITPTTVSSTGSHSTAKKD